MSDDPARDELGRFLKGNPSAWANAELRPHGTLAAYRRHYRHGEKPCRACRQAMSRRQDCAQ